MSKAFSQITFDFSAAEEQEPIAPLNEVLMEEEKEPVVQDSIPLESPTKKPPSTRGRRSLKEMAAAADLLDIPEDELLFQKQYYSIGEVAAMFHENQSLIRYWETEFSLLKPMKNRKGDRFFRPIDVKNLVLIYDLLRRRKFTIEGAKEFLKKNKRAEEKFAMIQSLEKMKAFFLEMKANL